MGIEQYTNTILSLQFRIELIICGEILQASDGTMIPVEHIEIKGSPRAVT